MNGSRPANGGRQPAGGTAPFGRHRPPDVGPFDYHVSRHRSDNFADYFVYPLQLPEPLLELAIPLLPGDGTVPLALQVAFHRAYDAGPYRREIDYPKDKITPPLRPPPATWVKGLVSGRKAAER